MRPLPARAWTPTAHALTDAGLRGLARSSRTAARGHDLALYAAGIAAYAAVGLVPALLLTVRLASWLTGGGDVPGAAALVELVPEQLGAREGAAALLTRGADLGWRGCLLSLLAAGVYGEGLVRGLDRLSVRGEAGGRARRGRVGAVVALALSPLLLLAVTGAAHALTDGLGDGLGPQLLGTYLAFLVAWLAISAGLLLVYRLLSPQRVGARALLWGGFGSGSVVAGFALGWVLFLRLGIPVERAYAGDVDLGAIAASAFWLVVLHALVLLGYVVTLELDARGGRPRGAVLRETTVRDAT